MKVSKRGKGGILLDIWHPTAGCLFDVPCESKRGVGKDGGWIWAFRLPMHLWGWKTDEVIGDTCRGLLDVRLMTVSRWSGLSYGYVGGS